MGGLPPLEGQQWWKLALGGRSQPGIGAPNPLMAWNGDPSKGECACRQCAQNVTRHQPQRETDPLQPIPSQAKGDLFCLCGQGAGMCRPRSPGQGAVVRL